MRKYVVIILLLICLLLNGCSFNDPIDWIYTRGLTVTEDVWDDLRTPVTSVRVPGARAPTWVGFRGSQILEFADQAVAGNEEEIYFALQIPHDYRQGSELRMHIHFVYPVNTVGDNVRWGLEYSWVNLDVVFPVSTTIYALTDATNNDADIHHLVSFAPIDGTGQLISSMLVCRLFRNSSNVNDTYANDVYFLEIDLHYIRDGLGSTQELVK